MMNGFEGHGWGMGWWWIIGLIIVIAVVWMVVKSMNTNSRANLPSGKSALDILKERYARGEITKEEFEEKKRALNI
jgi:putative membrane protein